jgi:hypothetical protein
MFAWKTSILVSTLNREHHRRLSSLVELDYTSTSTMRLERRQHRASTHGEILRTTVECDGDAAIRKSLIDFVLIHHGGCQSPSAEGV